MQSQERPKYTNTKKEVTTTNFNMEALFATKRSISNQLKVQTTQRCLNLEVNMDSESLLRGGNTNKDIFELLRQNILEKQAKGDIIIKEFKNLELDHKMEEREEVRVLVNRVLLDLARIFIKFYSNLKNDLQMKHRRTRTWIGARQCLHQI